MIEPQAIEAALSTGARSKPADKPVPAAAKWLGGLGALPFATLALASVVADGSVREFLSLALALYGAVILSFLGGVHWGLAIAGQGQSKVDSISARRLSFSVVPALAGWGALFLPTPFGLSVLAAAFVGMLLFDLEACQKGETPPWYPKLRVPLTIVVAASLLIGAVA